MKNMATVLQVVIIYVFILQQVIVNVLENIEMILHGTESFAHDFSYELGEVQLFCYN